MRMAARAGCVAGFVVLCAAAAGHPPAGRAQAQAAVVVAKPPTIADVLSGFATPPDDARPMMRWWWFGPAVEKPELEREILAMKAAGIGGFEIQPVYPLALDDKAKHVRNLPYLSDEFLDAVKFAAATARDNGMRVDITLGSGWPYGGPHVPVDQAAMRLRVVAVDVPEAVTSVAVPALGSGETLLAAFIGEGNAEQYEADKLQRLAVPAVAGRMAVEAGSGGRVVVFFVAGRTGQQVKRSAVNAEGFVLDHFSRAAVENHLHSVGDRLMKAFGDTPPYAVFSDSLEVYNADWTDDLPAEFKRRRGYDLTPYLPQLAAGTGELSRSVRRDWGLTLTELVDERYLTPVNEWAKSHGTRFRSQTYGDPAVSLASNRLVALPEGEGAQWKAFSDTRWASSASHLYGRPVTSAETWTWLHSPAFRATPLDMKAEADRFFLQGVNQIVGHGWPYSPLVGAEPGWSFYAAAALNDHNPWWGVMPDVTRYLQRVSYLLRQGKPANDVAVLLPDDDAYADFAPGKVSLSGGMARYVTPELMNSLLDAGYNVDFIDADAIRDAGISYPVLVLPHVERLAPETLKVIQGYVDRGGKVIAVGSLPSRAPGFLHAEEETAAVKEMTHVLFAKAAATQAIANDGGVGTAAGLWLAPDMKIAGGNGDVGFVHRKLPDADVYFVANTSNIPVSVQATFRSAHKFTSSWDAFAAAARRLEPGAVSLQLAPYESRIVVFSDAPVGRADDKRAGAPQMIGDMTRGWQVRFPGLGEDAAADDTFDAPSSWTEGAKTRFYSGEAVYTKTVSLGAENLSGSRRISLDFGEGVPVQADPAQKRGMRALLDAPVREAATVIVNGQRVGSLWHPPYTLDITGALHVGDNRIEIRVANTAINALAGRAPADCRLLWERYGQRFTPQDTEHLEPLPSGLLGHIGLMETK